MRSWDLRRLQVRRLPMSAAIFKWNSILDTNVQIPADPNFNQPLSHSYGRPSMGLRGPASPIKSFARTARCSRILLSFSSAQLIFYFSLAFGKARLGQASLGPQ